MKKTTDIRRWDDLSIAEKSKMMEVAIRNGITDLPTIKAKYNEFAEGGDTEGDDTASVNMAAPDEMMEKKNTFPNGGLMGGSPLMPFAAAPKAVNAIRRRAYKTINPLTDYDIAKNAKEFLKGNKIDYGDMHTDSEGNKYVEFMDGAVRPEIVDDIWATYLQIPESERRYDVRLQKSDYKPAMGGRKENTYYRLPLRDLDIERIIEETNDLKIGTNKVYGGSPLSYYNLADHTLGRGVDEEGREYRSYYDRWDLNPFQDKYQGTRVPLLESLGDVSLGLGTPVELYDRIYLDDYYGLPRSKGYTTYLPEVEVTPKDAVTMWDKEIGNISKEDFKKLVGESTPLKANKRAIGGPIVQAAMSHVYDGTTEDSQQMNVQAPVTLLNEVTVTAPKLTRMEREAAWRKREGNIAKHLISHPTLPNLFSAAEHYVNSIPGLSSAPSEITGTIAGEPLLPDVKNAAQLIKVGKVAKAIEDAVKGVEPVTKASKSVVDRSMPDFMRLMQNIDEALPVLSEKKAAEISRYANSQKNAAAQLRERMSDPEYAQMIMDNSNPIFRVGTPPVYIEGWDSRSDLKALLTAPIMEATEDPFRRLFYYQDALQAAENNHAFAIPHTPYALLPKKNKLLSNIENSSYLTKKQSNRGRQHQYSILKAHEGSHVYAHPATNSPLHPHLEGFEGDYLGSNFDAELSARGTQLKNYFDKKSLTPDELKYASANYVKDTGVDNIMTPMFKAMKKAAEKDPEIWKNMAKWLSEVAPIAALGLFTPTPKSDENK